jgi:hypothetical protein
MDIKSTSRFLDTDICLLLLMWEIPTEVGTSCCVLIVPFVVLIIFRDKFLNDRQHRVTAMLLSGSFDLVLIGPVADSVQWRATVLPVVLCCVVSMWSRICHSDDSFFLLCCVVSVCGPVYAIVMIHSSCCVVLCLYVVPYML